MRWLTRELALELVDYRGDLLGIGWGDGVAYWEADSHVGNFVGHWQPVGLEPAVTWLAMWWSGIVDVGHHSVFLEESTHLITLLHAYHILVPYLYHVVEDVGLLD